MLNVTSWLEQIAASISLSAVMAPGIAATIFLMVDEDRKLLCPQPFIAATFIVPLTNPAAKLTATDVDEVTTVSLLIPDITDAGLTIVQPAGTAHLYKGALLTAPILYVVPVIEVHTSALPLIAPGVDGLVVQVP